MCVAMSSGQRRSDDLQYTLSTADTIEIRISHRWTCAFRSWLDDQTHQLLRIKFYSTSRR